MMYKVFKVEKMMIFWVKFFEGILYGFLLVKLYIEFKIYGKLRLRNTLILLFFKKKYNVCIVYYRYK